MNPLRLFLVDDHHVFREGLRAVIASQPDLTVVGEASTGAAAMAQFDALAPDIVLLDISLPEISGVDLAQQMASRKPGIKILMLTAHRADEYLRDALSAGATGFASKAQPAEALLDAIRRVGAGEVYVARADATKVAQPSSPSTASSDPLGQLTKRELELFQLILHGFTNEALAKRLGISVKTVETHRASINRKLQVHSTADLVRFAARHDLLAKGG